MNDSVREELETKITPVSTSGRLDITNIKAAEPIFAAAPSVPVAAPPAPVKKAAPKPAKTVTSELHTKKTSPTLVGFQPKAPTMPEWRLQLQNKVRQRATGPKTADSSIDAVSPSLRKQPATSGANALKTDYVEEAKPTKHTNPKVAKALERIEESRKAFTSVSGETTAAAPAAPAGRNYPFNVVSRSTDTVAMPADAKPALSTSPKPRLVSSLRIEKKKFDTNKLPPLPPEPARLSSSLDEEVKPASGIVETEEIHIPAVAEETAAELEAVDVVNEVEVETEEHEEVDDLAPISHRFNAGLFDLIVGGFAGLIVLSPFMLSGGEWFSLSGILAIAAATAIVTFIYLTVSIGFIGRTVGMRLFGLELIDAEANEYPSLHQAAVHSSLFILSLTFAGLGFLPMLFNEERRAAHDLLSGTILVREF